MIVDAVERQVCPVPITLDFLIVGKYVARAREVGVLQPELSPENKNEGACLRRAPKSGRYGGYWPSVQSTFWCGEFKPYTE